MRAQTIKFLRALEDLDEALERDLEVIARMRERIDYLRAQLAAGRSLTDIVTAERPPLLVQQLTESANLLHTYGTRVRRTEAQALHQEGVTMEEIARLFGVSRQRVSALLRDAAGQPDR